MDELLIDVRESARRLGIGRTEMYGKLMSGEVPSVMIGRRRLVAVTDLEAWVAAAPRVGAVAVSLAVTSKATR